MSTSSTFYCGNVYILMFSFIVYYVLLSFNTIHLHIYFVCAECKICQYFMT